MADPSSITSPALICWLRSDRSDKITTANGSVSAMTDLSTGGNNAAQATASNRPDWTPTFSNFSAACIAHQNTSTGQWLNLTLTTNIASLQNCAMFMVVSPQELRSSNLFAVATGAPTTANNMLSVSIQNGNVQVYDGTGARIASLRAPSSRCMVGIVVNGNGANNVTVYVNTKSVAVTSSVNAAAATVGWVGSQIGLGASSPTSSNSLVGQWHEFVVYNGALTATQVRGLLDYWIAAWGVNPAPRYNLVIDGDSISGAGLNNPQELIWPTIAPWGPQILVQNYASPLQTLGGNLIPQAAANIDPLLGVAGGQTPSDTAMDANILMVMAGTNDIANSPTVSSATGVGVSPIVITLTGAAPFITGEQIVVSGVGGNTNANGTWTATVSGANVTLNGSPAGNANYTSGGTLLATPTGAHLALQTYCQARQAAGWRNILVGTMLARTGQQANQQAFNALVRANWPNYCSGVVDFGDDGVAGGSVTPIGSYAVISGANGTYWMPDGIHPSNPGQMIMARLYLKAVQNIIQPQQVGLAHGGEIAF